jgi:hypothetical protein
MEQEKTEKKFSFMSFLRNITISKKTLAIVAIVLGLIVASIISYYTYNKRMKNSVDPRVERLEELKKMSKPNDLTKEQLVNRLEELKKMSSKTTTTSTSTKKK